MDFVEHDAHFEKVLMTFGDCWVGMSKNTEKNSFLGSGGCIHGCVVVLVRMGKT